MKIKNIKHKMKIVEVKGFVHDFRDFGGLKFIQLRDSTGIIQITVIKNKSDQKILDIISEITKESAIKVEGKVQESKKMGLEIIPSKITIISKSEKDLPIPISISTSDVGQEKRFEWRSLDLRKLRQQAIFKIQSALVEGISEYLLKEDFIQIFTPCLMGVAAESGSEVFPVIYYDKEAFLRQDPQLHRQLTIAGGISKIFEIGPAWRAEQSHTSKHLCEHRVCAVELAFIKDEYDTMKVEEELVVAALSKVKEKCKKELEILDLKIEVPKTQFPVLKFPDIYKVLKERGKHLSEGEDLDSEAEQILWEYVQEKYGEEFYFITGFPSAVKPFYVMKIDETPKWARSVDLYFRGLELSSGGQREHRHDKLIQAVKDKGMKESEIEWFTKIFKYGVVPHGGFSIGIERLTQSLLKIKQIRDCVLFPRDPEMLVP